MTRIAICTHLSVAHYRGGEKWAVALANQLAEDDSLDISINALPYAPDGERRIDVDRVIDDSVDYTEAWRHDLSDVDTAYVFYHPGADVGNFPGAERYIAGIHSWVYVSPALFESQYGILPTAVKLLYRTVGEYDLGRYDAVHTVTPAFESSHNRSIFIPNFVDTARYNPDRAALNDEFTVLVTAAHIDEKGWDTSKAVARQLSDDISVVTTGSAETPHIDGMGFLSEEALADQYAQAHAVLHPARVDTDSMVINEACSSGTPVVTTPLRTHIRSNEAVLHGESPAALAALLEQLAAEYRSERAAYSSRCEVARETAAKRSIPTVMTKLRHLLTVGSEDIPDVEPTLREYSGHDPSRTISVPSNGES